jgi:hypothetical protein
VSGCATPLIARPSQGAHPKAPTKGVHEQRIRAWANEVRAGAGPVKVFGLKEIIGDVRQAAAHKQYRDNPVLVTMKALEAAGTLTAATPNEEENGASVQRYSRSVDPAEMLTRLRASAVPIDDVRAPTKPGVYAWYLDERDALTSAPHRDAEPIYIGMSTNLAERGDETHFQSGQTGFSTLRRSLGALLKGELQLRAQPRGTGASEQNYRCYRFDDAGEDRLTDWMTRHLRVAVLAYPDPSHVEAELVTLAQPPLNLNKWANPSAAEIKALRKACADEARRDHPR